MERQPDGTEWIEVSQEGRRMAELVFDTTGPKLPVDGSVIPPRLRAIRTDRERFPEIRTSNVMMALRAPRFELTFPVAETAEEPAPITGH